MTFNIVHSIMKFFFTLPLILVNLVLLAQTNHSPSSIAKKIEVMASQQQWALDIPGFTVGVIVDDQVVLKKAYGFQNLQKKEALSTASDFHMASVSKPFAATAILQLVESGKVNLDSTIAHYLPYFKMNDNRYKKITLCQILNHSSGIPDVTDYEWDKPKSGDKAAEDYVKSFFDKGLDFEPGSQFNYSNSAYNILADIIAKVSGVSFEQYMHDHIFIPAGMAQSSFLLSDIKPNRIALPYIIGNDLELIEAPVYPYNRIHAPSSTLHSNLDDMMKWAQLFLNKGKIQGHSLISEKTWENMIQPRFKVNEEFNVCLSWFTINIGSKTIYFHSGGDTGYRTFVGFEPKSKTAVVLMGNHDFFDATEPGFAIFKSILEDTTFIPKKPIYLDLRHYILKGGIEKVKQVYFTEYQTHGGKYLFGPENVIPLANWLYDRGYKQQTIDVLLFCTELEPKVAKWYEYIGDVYMASEDHEKALVWFKKALTVEPLKKEIEKKILDLNKK